MRVSVGLVLYEEKLLGQRSEARRREGLLALTMMKWPVGYKEARIEHEVKSSCVCVSYYSLDKVSIFQHSTRFQGLIKHSRPVRVDVWVIAMLPRALY